MVNDNCGKHGWRLWLKRPTARRMTMIDASKKINRAIESGVTATLAPKMHRNGGGGARVRQGRFQSKRDAQAVEEKNKKKIRRRGKEEKQKIEKSKNKKRKREREKKKGLHTRERIPTIHRPGGWEEEGEQTAGS